MPLFKKITLDNGLRIVLAPQPQGLATTVLVLVEAGSKYETKEINGLSHFLEHMCFKGTKKRPRSIDIASELDGIGAAHNAFTGHEYTGYYAKAEPRHFGKIFDIISDMYLNPVFDPKEIDKERGVIIEEINMYEDLPMRQVGDEFMALLYGDQPAGRNLAGTKENVRKISRDDFIDYRAKHYLAKSTIVVIAGNFDEAEAVESVKKSFGNISTSQKEGKVKTIESQSRPEVAIKHKDTDQTHIVLGVRTFDIFDKRRYALDVLSDILGGGASSRLFQKIREEMGAAYYVSASSDLFTDHGFLSVSAGIDNKRIEEIVLAILGEFKKVAEEPIKEEEIEKAKEYSVGHLMLGLETSDALASYYGGQEVVAGEIKDPLELAEKIRAVTLEELSLLAREIMDDAKLNLAIIGPFKDKERFEKILTLK
ncbi:MAG: pitrilysin family protein [Candidatus Wolfebacteria bacterium]|nr:pitrilysin family protein [Candidatus Wolfebacteria bacterium]